MAGLQIKSSIKELKGYLKKVKEYYPNKTFKQFLEECLKDKETTTDDLHRH